MAEIVFFLLKSMFLSTSLSVGTFDQKATELCSLHITEGTSPVSNDEIMLEKSLLSVMFCDKTIGDTIELTVNEKTKKFTISGAYENISTMQWEPTTTFLFVEPLLSSDWKYTEIMPIVLQFEFPTISCNPGSSVQCTVCECNCSKWDLWISKILLFTGYTKWKNRVIQHCNAYPNTEPSAIEGAFRIRSLVT